MPKSKRNRVIPLSKVTKKDFNDKKIKLVSRIEKYLSKYKFCYFFSYKNMTNLAMQSLKEYFSTSVFIVGKNKVMNVAFKLHNNKYNIENYLKGNCGLFFSDIEPDEIIEYFSKYSSPYYAKQGTIANKTIILKRGFDENLKDFPSNMFSQLRQLGLNVKLDNGQFCLLDDYELCKEGKEITSDQSKMIKHLGIYMDEFKIYIKAYIPKNGDLIEIEKDNKK
jgi:mRNA turnover protein 4